MHSLPYPRNTPKSPEKAFFAAKSPHYPELQDKTCSVKSFSSLIAKDDWSGDWDGRDGGEDFPVCYSGFVQGEVEGSLYRHAKMVLCGKEYCPTCGRDASWVHRRRVSRWLPKALQWVGSDVGYLVITFPTSLRKYLGSKEILAEFRTYLRRKFKREGITHGLAAYHLFGSCKDCRGNGCGKCSGTGAGRKFHPHINFLFRKGYWKPFEMRKFRQEVAVGLKEVFLRYWLKEKEIKWEGEGTSGPSRADEWSKIRSMAGRLERRFNWHYQYSSQPGKLYHWLKYVSRSTDRFYESDHREDFHNFRNRTTWGKWVNLSPEKVAAKLGELGLGEELTEVDRAFMEKLKWYHENRCMMTGGRIKWGKYVSKSRIDRQSAKLLKGAIDYTPGGYFLIRVDETEEEAEKVLRETRFRQAQRYHREKKREAQKDFPLPP